MGKHEGKSPTKESILRAEAVFKKATADDAKSRSQRDVQSAEATARDENMRRLRAMRLAKEAAEAEARNKI